MTNMQAAANIALGFLYLLEGSNVVQLTVCTEENEITQIFRRLSTSWISGGECMSIEEVANIMESKVDSSASYEIKVFNQEKVTYKH